MLELEAHPIMLQLTTLLFLIAFSTLAAIHIIAIKLFLYWHYLWFDIPMHLFGGVIVSLGLFTLRDLGLFPNTFLKKPLTVLAFVLGVAIVWELYEVAIGIPAGSGLVFDTAVDITMGMIGGYIGYIIGNSLRNLR